MVTFKWYIIGTEELYWIPSKRIFQNRHRLSNNVWEKTYDIKIPSNLQEQYEVSDNEYDFKGILLSPFAKRRMEIIYVARNVMNTLKNHTEVDSLQNLQFQMVLL